MQRATVVLGHQLPWALEAAHIADLGHKGHGGQQRYPAHGLISLDDRRHRPSRNDISDLLRQPLEAGLGILDRLPVLAQNQILSRMLKNN